MATGVGVAGAHAAYSTVVLLGPQRASTLLGHHQATSAVIVIGLGVRMVYARAMPRRGVAPAQPRIGLRLRVRDVPGQPDDHPHLAGLFGGLNPIPTRGGPSLVRAVCAGDLRLTVSHLLAGSRRP